MLIYNDVALNYILSIKYYNWRWKNIFELYYDIFKKNEVFRYFFSLKTISNKFYIKFNI